MTTQNTPLVKRGSRKNTFIHLPGGLFAPWLHTSTRALRHLFYSEPFYRIMNIFCCEVEGQFAEVNFSGWIRRIRAGITVRLEPEMLFFFYLISHLSWCFMSKMCMCVCVCAQHLGHHLLLELSATAHSSSTEGLCCFGFFFCLSDVTAR